MDVTTEEPGLAIIDWTVRHAQRRGTFKATLLHVLADDDHSVAMQRSEATVNGKQV